MLALEMKSTKNFMSALLTSDTFDIFLLEEAVLRTASTFTIDGHLNKEFYTSEEWEDSFIRPYDYMQFKDIKGLCFDMIKGKHTPVSFKFVLQLYPEYISSILEKGTDETDSSGIKALLVTVKFDGSKITLITGVSYHTFVMDKEPEKLWDEGLKRFLLKKGLDFEIIA